MFFETWVLFRASKHRRKHDPASLCFFGSAREQPGIDGDSDLFGFSDILDNTDEKRRKRLVDRRLYNRAKSMISVPSLR